MSETRDGGPAYPGEQGSRPDGTWNQTWDPGMSLRDYFAAKALSGSMSNPDNDYATWSDRAKDCVAAADALLAALAKEAEHGT